MVYLHILNAIKAPKIRIFVAKGGKTISHSQPPCNPNALKCLLFAIDLSLQLAFLHCI